MEGRTIENRRPGLDVIRCMAILPVMLHHFRNFDGCPEWFAWFAMRGYIGVDLFFVLSGWLIGGQLIRKYRASSRIEPTRFWFRRWARTIPPYFVMVGLLVLLGKLSLSDVSVFLVFLQNYTGDVGSWIISWSLCVEEHFYLVLPVFFFVLVKIRHRWVVAAIAAALILGPPALRWYALPAITGNRDLWCLPFLSNYYSVTHLRLEGLAIGVTLAALFEYKTAAWGALQRSAKEIAAIGVILVIVFTWNPLITGATDSCGERMDFMPWVVGFLMVSLGTGLVLPWANRWESKSRLLLPIVFFSDHAYALYLTHDLCRYYTARWFSHAPFWICVSLAFCLSFVASALLRQCIEVPSLRFRDWALKRSR